MSIDDAVMEDIHTAATALLPLLQRPVDFSKCAAPPYEHIVYRIACVIHLSLRKGGNVALFANADDVSTDLVRPLEGKKFHAVDTLDDITYIMDAIWNAVDAAERGALGTALKRDRFFAGFVRNVSETADDVVDVGEMFGAPVQLGAYQAYIKSLASSIALLDDKAPLILENVGENATGMESLRQWSRRLYRCWLHPDGMFSRMCLLAREVAIAYPAPSALVFPLRFVNSIKLMRASLDTTVRRVAALELLEHRARFMLRITEERGFRLVNIASEIFSTDHRDPARDESSADQISNIIKKPLGWIPRCMDHLVKHANVIKHDARKSLAWFGAVSRRDSSPEQIERELAMISAELYPGNNPRVEFHAEVRRWLTTYLTKGSMSVDDYETYSTKCHTMVNNARDEFKAYIAKASGASSATAPAERVIVDESRSESMPYTQVICSVEDILSESNAPGLKKPFCPVAFDLMMQEVQVIFNPEFKEPRIDTSGIYTKYKLDLTPHAVRACLATVKSGTTKLAATGDKPSPVSLWVQYARHHV